MDEVCRKYSAKEKAALTNFLFARAKTPPLTSREKISGKCGGLWGLVSLLLDSPSRVRISARGLPIVWSEERQITL